MSEDTSSIYTLMANVMRSIGGVGKDDWNDHQRFNFRGIDALHNAIYGPLCEHGVFVAPEVLDAHYADVQTSQNKPSRQATLRVRYTFYGPDGGSVSVVSQGEAMDSADKATSKAMAMAFKYALLQTFVIPTEDQDDADASTPERGQPQQQQPAPAAEPEPAPEPSASFEQVARFDAICEALDVDKRKALSDWMERNYGVDLDGFANLSESWAESLLGHVEPQGATA